MIRRARASDVEALTGLLYEIHGVHAELRPDIFRPGAKKFHKEELLQLIESDREPIFVCEENGEVLAHAFCELKVQEDTENLVGSRTLFLEDFCVAERARGRGVGRELYNFVVERAKELGCSAITLNVWICNRGAVAFYESMGLTPRSMIMEQKL